MPPRTANLVRVIGHSYFGEKELGVIRSITDKSRASIDVGANNGVYTYHLSRLTRYVYAFEPNAECVRYLKNVCRPNVEIFPYAASNASGEARLCIPLRKNGQRLRALGSLSNENFKNFDKCEIVKVRKTLLDDIVNDDVGFIKIDVEGHEEEVVEGAADLVLRCKPNLLVEIEQRHLSKPLTEVVTSICAFGYKAFFMRNKSLEEFAKFSVERDQLRLLEQWETSRSTHKVPYINNFIFIPV